MTRVSTGGSPADTALPSPAAVSEVVTPQTIAPDDAPSRLLVPPAASDGGLLAYGLGWFVHSYRGRRIVWHGGDTDGMAAVVALVPEARLGVAVLSNLQLPRTLPYSLAYRILDRTIGPGKVRRRRWIRSGLDCTGSGPRCVGDCDLPAVAIGTSASPAGPPSAARTGTPRTASSRWPGRRTVSRCDSDRSRRR